MDERRPHLEQIRAALRAERDGATPDHGPWLVYADRLEEWGETDAAELVRVGVELHGKVRELPVVDCDELNVSRELIDGARWNGYHESLDGPLTCLASGVASAENIDELNERCHRVRPDEVVEVRHLGRHLREFVVTGVSETRPHIPMAGSRRLFYRRYTCTSRGDVTISDGPFATLPAGRLKDLEARQKQLLRGGATGIFSDGDDIPEARPDRGLVGWVRCPWAWWWKHGDAALERQPITEVVITTLPNPLGVNGSWPEVEHDFRQLVAKSRWVREYGVEFTLAPVIQFSDVVPITLDPVLLYEYEEFTGRLSEQARRARDRRHRERFERLQIMAQLQGAGLTVPSSELRSLAGLDEPEGV